MPSEDELKSMPRLDLISRVFMWQYTYGMEQDLIKNRRVVRNHFEANSEIALDQIWPQSTSARSKLADFIGLLYVVLGSKVRTLHCNVYMIYTPRSDRYIGSSSVLHLCAVKHAHYMRKACKTDLLTQRLSQQPNALRIS